ncbi:MAG TPA: hypothetical protein PK876_05915 [Elusimicrobiota bacterium]|nr:hypothetical protein [Elusimicrobiota bacterium]
MTLVAPSLSLVEWIAVVLVIGGTFGGIFYEWVTHAPGRQRTVLGLLRLLLLALLVYVSFQPAAQKRTRKESVRLAVVLDSSESMGVSAGLSSTLKTRWEIAVESTRKVESVLGRGWQADYHVLNGVLARTDIENISGMRPVSPMTDLCVMGQLTRSTGSLDAVILLSDGRHGGPRNPLAELPKMGVPVFTIGIGREDQTADLSVENVSSPPFAFKDTDTEVTFRIRKDRLTASSVTVQLYEERRLVASQEISLSTSVAVTESRFRFQPTRTGTIGYSVRVPSYRGEANTKNNTKRFWLNVSRDKLRVLYISGQPGPSYAFLRHQLKTNPSVELVSFVILRDPQDAFSIPDDQLALIPFPSQDILLNQVKTFDVVILEQFSFRQFGIGPSSLSVFREFVDRGGGLLLMGDSSVLGPEGPYRNTLFEEMSPVRWGPISAGLTKRFHLNEFNSRHPVMTLSENAEESRRQWSQMPALEGNGVFPETLNLRGALLAGYRHEGRLFPVVAASSSGQGRILQIGVLTLWRWAMTDEGKGAGAWVYQQFWNNVLRWLASADDFQLVHLEIPTENMALSEHVPVRVHVRDEMYRPDATAQVHLSVLSPSDVQETRRLVPTAPGIYADYLSLVQPGRYRVKAWAVDKSRRLGEDVRLLTVGHDWDEASNVNTDFDLLKGLSQRTGGEFIPADQLSEAWLKKKLPKESWGFSGKKTVWDSPWIFFCIVGILLVEWLLRKRWGKW